MVRNAVAHGIESETERLAAGKPPRGKVRLEIHRRGRRVAFVLVDDTVTHEVRNHRVYVVARRGAGSELLGILQYPARRLEVAIP